MQRRSRTSGNDRTLAALARTLAAFDSHAISGVGSAATHRTDGREEGLRDEPITTGEDQLPPARLLQSVLDGLVDGVIAADPDGRIIAANRRIAERVLAAGGYPVVEVAF